MDSDAMLGGLGGQRLSRAEEKIRIRCPRCVKETKNVGDGT